MKFWSLFELSLLGMLLLGCEQSDTCGTPVGPPAPIALVEEGSYALSSVSDNSLAFAHSGVRDLRMEIDRGAGKVRVTYVRDGKPVEEFWTIAETTP